MKHKTVHADIKVDRALAPIRIDRNDLPKERAVLPPQTGGFHSAVRGNRVYRRNLKHKSPADE